MRRTLCALLALSLVAPPAFAIEAVEDAFPLRTPPAFQLSAYEVVDRAFENFYGCDLQQKVDLVVRSGGKQIYHYKTQMARKHMDGVVYRVTQFLDAHLTRRVRVLRIHRRDRSDDFFVWLPQLRRVRRLTTAQRADKPLGLNLTLEDIEMQFVEKFEILGRTFGDVRGEPVHVVTLGPLFDSGYDRADFFVSQTDFAILEIRYYRQRATEPFKVARAQRGEMQVANGHVLPRRMMFTNRVDGTETEVFFHSRSVDPELPDSLFTKTNLEGELRSLRFEASDDTLFVPR